MVNAGAIAVASLIKKGSAVAGVRAFVDKMQLAAGRKLKIDSSVLASESATGNRNRAIAYLMLNFGIIDEDINHTLHQYFSQCSLLVNCRDLAMMAASLANMGAEDSGSAVIAGRELPPAAALAASQLLTARARQLRKAGITGGMDELRVLAYLEKLSCSPSAGSGQP